jgi:hypothetical protein
MTPEQLDAWRAVPRTLVTMYAIMFWQICQWFMALPDPTAAQSAFVSTVVGASAGWFGLYVHSGRQRE